MPRKLLKKVCFVTRNDAGVQLVELAIVLPVLLMLFGAAAEFGRYFYEYTTLAKASRVAVRYLVTARTDGTDDLAAKNLVVYGNVAGTGNKIISGLDVDNVKITRTPANSCVPTTVTIEIINFPHSSILKLDKLTKNSSASLDIQVKPSVTMRYLVTQCLV
jgi:Flp pilus assembly protein TadG